MLWGLQKTTECHLASTAQEKLRSHTELHTKLLLSNSGAWLGERFKLGHVLRKQLFTPNYTTRNSKQSFGNSSPAGTASTQTTSHQKLIRIPGHGSSIQTLNSSGWIWGYRASELHWGGTMWQYILSAATHAHSTAPCGWCTKGRLAEITENSLSQGDELQFTLLNLPGGSTGPWVQAQRWKSR